MDQRPTDPATDQGEPPAATDRPATDHAPGTGRPPTDPTDQPAAPALLSVEAAAAELGISSNAVRQRIKRRTLFAVKTEAGWLVATDRPTTVVGRQPDHDRPPTNPTTTPTDHRPHPTDQAGIRTSATDVTEVAPLVGLVADLTRENRELAAAAAVWQERARTLEVRLQALGAGVIAVGPQAAPPEAPGASAALPPAPDTSQPIPSRWRRWARALVGS